jgi:hypothetical protein
VLIGGAFFFIAWDASAVGAPLFMAALAAAVVGYIWMLAATGRAGVSRRTLRLALVAAIVWRVPLIFMPEIAARDAVRYVWDARVQRAGLSQYETRPGDPQLDALHSSLTRGVDASSLPTIYPPVAQVYFRAITAVHESLVAFRIAALACDVGVMIVLVSILRASGRPERWVLAYAWHPLVPIEAVLGAHLEPAGVLALMTAHLFATRGRPWAITAAFSAAVLIKPLPIVLAPLIWRHVGGRHLAAAFGGVALLTLWVARGQWPIGSITAFIDYFRFNAPLFVALEQVVSPRGLAIVAVTAGLAAALWIERRRDRPDPGPWGWPLAVALAFAPVIYPWYLLWLLPFAVLQRSATLLAWTLSVLTIYPAWFLWTGHGAMTVPAPLWVVEFAVPVMTALAVWSRSRPRGAVRRRWKIRFGWR